jgi:hypothetical protein
MDSGLSVKPVVSLNVTAPVRAEPAPAQQAVASELPPEKSVTAPPKARAADDQSADSRSARAREVVIDNETQQVIFRARNVQSGEVVWQVPEESLLRLRAYVRSLDHDRPSAMHQADVEA